MESTISKFTFRALLDRRVLTMLFLGFSAGLPILLIFGTLSVWLREAGVSRSMVTYFSWAALGYSFKFVWAPLVDQLKLPLLYDWLGRRRSWLLLSQCMVIVAIWLMSGADPAGPDGVSSELTGSRPDGLLVLAIGAVLLGFSSATQDIVIDAFRIESAEPRMQALLSSTYIAGYRIAMILAGAGGLLLAESLGSTHAQYSYEAWRDTYRMISGAMLLGIITTLIIREPTRSSPVQSDLRENLQLVILFILCVSVFISAYVWTSSISDALGAALADVLSNKVLAGFFVESARLAVALAFAWVMAKFLITTGLVKRQIIERSYLGPVRDFFDRYGVASAWLLLALIGLYRISDIVLGVISNVFYYDLGFNKSEIAAISKTFGVVMTIVGGFLGGILAFRFGVIRVLMLGALLSAGTNLLFMLLANAGHHTGLLYIVIGADNLSAGIASAAFIAFLSALTNIKFTAVQYAIFSSLMTLIPKVLGGYSGTMVDSIGYSNFFIVTTLLGLPVVILIILAARRLDIDAAPQESISKAD